MAVTLCSGEEEKGSTAFENPERYQRVEYSHVIPNKVKRIDEINKILMEKLTARKIGSFFMDAALRQMPPDNRPGTVIE
jgi:hypothetical protein